MCFVLSAALDSRGAAHGSRTEDERVGSGRLEDESRMDSCWLCRGAPQPVRYVSEEPLDSWTRIWVRTWHVPVDSERTMILPVDREVSNDQVDNLQPRGYGMELGRGRGPDAEVAKVIEREEHVAAAGTRKDHIRSFPAGSNT